ncbi:MAG: 30S ribosomal protein S6 [Firmicutes bacterium]|nr:30S ribosomal protein S6 [Bacillota bacterium]
MRGYELVLIIKPDLDDEALEAVIEKVRSMIENDGGTIAKIDKWGKRRLAYEIKDLREGIYYIINFKGEAAVSAELDRVLKITDSVLRHMIVREEE